MAKNISKERMVSMEERERKNSLAMGENLAEILNQFLRRNFYRRINKRKKKKERKKNSF